MQATLATAEDIQRFAEIDKEFTDAWRDIALQINMNRAIGMAYQQLAQRLSMTQAINLAGILEVGLKTGADLVAITELGGEQLQAQLDFEEKRAASQAARRLEGCILLAAPLLLTFLLSGTLSEYMLPLYQGAGCWLMFLIFLLQMLGGLIFWFLIAKDETGEKVIELATFMECLVLLLQAGLTLPSAWQQAALMQEKAQALKTRSLTDYRYGQKNDPSFVRSVQKANAVLKFNGSFSAALEQLKAGNCDEDVLCFVELLQQNFRKGGGTLAKMLSRESARMRQSQGLLIERQGGRREIWLLFPLVFMLLSSLLLTAAPAILSLGH